MNIQLLAGRFYVPCETWSDKGRQFFKFRYNRGLVEEFKAMQGRKWHPDEKAWSVPLTTRNKFSLSYIIKDEPDPYEPFDKELIEFSFTRPLWEHQQKMVSFFMTRKYCLLAAEQGTGKSMAIIEAMERSGLPGEDIFYVSTRAGLESMRLEAKKWDCQVAPTMMTFEGLRKKVEEWPEGKEPPKMLIGDESSRLKNITATRTKNFQNLADAIREVHGDSGYVILCTGTPAPNTVVDWWSQTEIAYPGFIKEGSPAIFRSRMALIEYKENEIGQSYPEVVTWWDNEDKCKTCGKCEKDKCFRPDCKYQKSVNEFLEFYNRADGLVSVMEKKDCMDLPDKHYKSIWCSDDTLKDYAKEVVELYDSPIQCMVALRCLSDGFQYTSEEVGKTQCPECTGSGESLDYVGGELDWEIPEVMAEGVETECWRCSGSGEISKYKRTFIPIDTPKLKQMEILIEEHEDVGRMVVFGAFHATIDRLTELFLSKGWTVMKVDGRGWQGITPDGKTIPREDMVETFQAGGGKIAWVAHPESSGTGLTLTASPTIVFYSNTFKGDDRLQAEDRCHRKGMDENKGLTIYDIYALETDEMIRENLETKRWQQDLTIGRIQERLGL